MSVPVSSVRSTSVLLSAGTRGVQEDFVLSEAHKGFFVLADGFGGAQGGPGMTASKTACECVRDFLVREARDRDATLPFVLRSYFSLAGNVLFNSIIHANRSLLKLNRGKSVHERGGASLIAGYLDGSLLAIANVGVCSARLYRGGEVRELVIPRSYRTFAEPFALSEANEFPDVPLMALGVAEDLEPEIFEYRLQPGDWLVFYSDGVSDHFLQEVGQFKATSENSSGKCAEVQNELKNRFEAQSFRDNASILLVIL